MGNKILVIFIVEINYFLFLLIFFYISSGRKSCKD